jgi:hypothetical protein
VQPVGTGRRAFIRQAFGASSSGWAALTSAEQAAWASYANSFPITDSLGQSIKLTGQQMYVSISTQLLNCGQSPTFTPPVTNAVFSAGLPTFTAVSAGAITVTPTGTGGASDFLLIAFSRPLSSGRSFNATYWQDTHVAGNSVVPIVATTAYHTQFGTPPVGTRIFLKATPVNQYGVTGVPSTVIATVT